MTTEDQDFKNRAEHALTVLYRELLGAGDDYGYQTKMSGGAIQVDCRHPPAKLVVSLNLATRQVLVSAPGKSYRLDWDIVENAFIHTESGETLKELLEGVLSKLYKEDVTL